MKKLAILAMMLTVTFMLWLPGCSEDEVTFGNQSECTDGETKDADDGCNTCVCNDGEWACTEMACDEPCTDGETKDADDGCNTCVCENGEWGCTLMGCEEPCTDGETKDADDGCNTCVCENGEWACTLMGCEEPCTDGETKDAEDGCNTCVCEDGEWACTEMACDDLDACIAECGDGCFMPEHMVCGEDGQFWCPCEMECHGIAEAEYRNFCCDPMPPSDCWPYCAGNVAYSCEIKEDSYGCPYMETSEQDCGERECIEDFDLGEAYCEGPNTDPDQCIEENCGDGCFLPEHMVCGEDGQFWCPCEMECHGIVQAEDRYFCCDPIPPGCIPDCIDNVAYNCTVEDDDYGCPHMEFTEQDCGDQGCIVDYDFNEAYCEGPIEPDPEAQMSFSSGCLNRNKDSEPEVERMEAVFDPASGAVSVSHYNVMLNCCLERVEPILTLENNTIYFWYDEDYGQYGPCYCICPYNMEFSIFGLSSGSYEINYGSGAMMTTANVTVP